MDFYVEGQVAKQKDGWIMAGRVGKGNLKWQMAKQRNRWLAKMESRLELEIFDDIFLETQWAKSSPNILIANFHPFQDHRRGNK